MSNRYTKYYREFNQLNNDRVSSIAEQPFLPSHLSYMNDGEISVYNDRIFAANIYTAKTLLKQAIIVN